MSHKYLLCRPLGGFNDTLVQIEKCRRYAEKFDRILVVDSSRGGLRDDFSRYFETSEKLSVYCEFSYEKFRKKLPRIESSHPKVDISDLDTYKTHTIDSKVCVQGSAFPLTFDFRENYPEDLLIHEQFGGGIESISLLQQLRFRPDIAIEVNRRLECLGPDYDAIHIRNSDYRTDYETYLGRLQRTIKGRPVLLCTDSYIVQKYAKSFLENTCSLHFLTNISENTTTPLHYADHNDIFESNIELLTDLIGLSRSRNLYFTKIENGYMSGFSILAYILHKIPRITENILHLTDNPKEQKPEKTAYSFENRFFNFLNYVETLFLDTRFYLHRRKLFNKARSIIE